MKRRFVADTSLQKKDDSSLRKSVYTAYTNIMIPIQYLQSPAIISDYSSPIVKVADNLNEDDKCSNADRLIISGSTYAGTASTVTVGQTLPGGGIAIANGTYPDVFKNDTVDGSFGITSPIFLQEITTCGKDIRTMYVDPSVITTSFPSKSELALNPIPVNEINSLQTITNINSAKY